MLRIDKHYWRTCKILREIDSYYGQSSIINQSTYLCIFMKLHVSKWSDSEPLRTTSLYQRHIFHFAAVALQQLSRSPPLYVAFYRVLLWEVVDGEVDIVRGHDVVPRQSVGVVSDQYRLVLCRRRVLLEVVSVEAAQCKGRIQRHVLDQ